MYGLCINIQNIAYKEAGPDYHTGRHIKKKALQWYCVMYGKVNMVVDGFSNMLNPGDAILIPAESVRSPHCVDSKAPGYLISDFINNSLDLDSMKKRKVHLPTQVQPDLRALTEELKGHPGRDTLELTQALLVRILIELSRSIEFCPLTSSFLNKGYRREVVNRAEVFMQRNLHRQLSRQDIAQSVNLSAPHLARIIKTDTKKTITGRLTELRISRAKELLLGTTLPITQISFEVGYESFSHFSKVFKNHVGVRPSDYRKGDGMVWRTGLIKSTDTFVNSAEKP